MFVPISPAAWMFMNSSSSKNNYYGSSYNPEWEMECLELLQHVKNQLPSNINVRYLSESKYFEFLIDMGENNKAWPKYTVEFIKENKNNITELFKRFVK
jgi:hypothetical protein